MSEVSPKMFEESDYTNEKLKEQENEYTQRLLDHTYSNGKSTSSGELKLGIVMQGHSFSHILHNDELKGLFVEVASLCESIIICRSSPS